MTVFDSFQNALWLLSLVFCFLVACTRLYNPLCPLVGLLVGRLVLRSHFTFFYDFITLTSLLLPKCSGDLKYGRCPPTRNFSSHVSGLVLSCVDSLQFIKVAFTSRRCKYSKITEDAECSQVYAVYHHSISGFCNTILEKSLSHY